MTAIPSNSVVLDGVVEFLRNVPPFQFLPVGELRSLARTMSLEYFPKDSTILRAGTRSPDALFIIQRGGVKLSIRTHVGKQLILDMRSEGEIFGVLSFMARDVARLDVTAVEDTLCYTVPAEEMQDVMSRHADVADYLVRTSVSRYIDRSLKELRAQTNLMGNSERLLYTIAARDLVRGPAITCAPTTSIKEAARIATSTGSSCICIVDQDGAPHGIVTDRDFTTKVVDKALAPDVSVREIMTSPVIAVEGSELLFQVLVRMLNHNIHHVVVTERGIAVGVLNSNDLILLQGKSPLTLARHIQEQTSVDGLAEAQQRVAGLLPLLLREGAKSRHITHVVAEMNDQVITRILRFAHERFGEPPVPYCWIVLGSEGRREQTFKTDQDNALLYADPTGTDESSVSGYFEKFAEYVKDSLVRCGYPLCEGEFMASNPRWRRSLSGWKEFFTACISAADRRSAEDELLFFDMRPVYGDSSLFSALQAHLLQGLQHASTFKSVLAYISIEHKPPLGFFRNFVVERSGEHKHELDLKWYGTGPIVNAARLYALDQGVEKRNTLERLAELQPVGMLTDALLQDLQESFEFLTLLRIEMQLQSLRSGQPPSNYVRPEHLNHLQRSLLKESFRTIARTQSAVIDRFESAVWPQLAR